MEKVCVSIRTRTKGGIDVGPFIKIPIIINIYKSFL